MNLKPQKKQDSGVSVLSEDMEVAQTHYISKVYIWMAMALAVTGLCAYYVASTPTLVNAIVTNRILFFGLMIAEVGLVIFLSARIHKMSYSAALTAFIVYSLLNGATLSVIFLTFTTASISRTFFITAGTFAVMSVFGYTTKSDLTKFGRIFMMLLVGIIIASIVNFFMHSETLYWIVSYVGVAVFVGLIAYDTQKIKRYFQEAQGDEEAIQKISIMGALSLYLDFINLFLFLLRIFGGRRN